jgi:hypothetical protein
MSDCVNSFKSLNRNGIIIIDDFSTDGMIEYAPLIVLSGAKKNEITVTLPQAIAPVTNISFINNHGQNILFNVTKIALKLYGLNGQNASKFQG